MRTWHLSTELRLERPLEEVFPFFADPRNLERITPPWLRFRVLGATTDAIEEGTEIDYALRVHGVPLLWCSRITCWEPPYRFVDEQVRGPYALWRHLHTFTRDGAGTLARDWVEYAVPGGALVRQLFVRRDVERIFAYRSEVLPAALAEAGALREAPAAAPRRSPLEARLG
ncbi:MAG: SRPBCC family protein [Planctomycetes bacterium]|nr:SRPBCC family protein [Planctomycetota bacterium]